MSNINKEMSQSSIEISDQERSDLRLGFPNEVDSDGIYSSTITRNKNEPYIIQSCRVFWDLNDKLILKNDHKNKGIENFYDTIRDVETETCKQISQCSEKWFGTHLEPDYVEELFTSIVKVPKSFKEPYELILSSISEDLKIYDIKKRKRTREDVTGEVTVLLHAKSVFITTTYCRIEWELIHVMVHKKKEVINLGNLTIQEEPEEHVPVNLFKKNQIIDETESIATEPIRESVKESVIESVKEINENPKEINENPKEINENPKDDYEEPDELDDNPDEN